MSGRDPVGARTSSGCPRSADKPRAPSLVVDQGMNSIKVGEEGKREFVDWFCVNWIVGDSITHDPPIFIEGSGLIPVGNIPKT